MNDPTLLLLAKLRGMGFSIVEDNEEFHITNPTLQTITTVHKSIESIQRYIDSWGLIRLLMRNLEDE